MASERRLEDIMRVHLLLTAAALSFLAAACGSSTMPTTPTAPTTPTTPSSPTPPATTLDVAGAWNGTSVDSQGATVVSWTVAQDGTQVSGTVHTSAPDPNDGSCNACHRNKSGTFTGTISDGVLTMTLHFAAGVDGDPTPICSATMTGSAASLTAGQLSGSYTGSDTCEGAFLNGTIAMTRK
jgi:hypothetical protein